MDDLLDDFQLEKDIENAEHAGFWNRVAASIIDSIIIGLPLGLLSFVIGINNEEGLTNLISILVNWLYNVLQETSTSKATIGKKALGIEVVDINGEKLTFSRATGRLFGKYISALILGIGFIMAGFTEKKQALHDIMANTLVIKK